MTIPFQPKVYKVKGRDGQRYVIYNASAIGDPPDHKAGKWYYRPYPIQSGTDGISPAFGTPDEAERAVAAQPTDDSNPGGLEKLLKSLHNDGRP